eukprot:TRINITY_DN26603_c1_g4_i1.p1 TRINITY_DN26603_c1_g4~~TRINITY_DN26603_c1_g4_i1.p1  ORF type:complete len:445 (+),score=64.79 TRINITY_DN26603_c1_g4_i1:66-1400(+)
MMYPGVLSKLLFFCIGELLLPLQGDTCETCKSAPKEEAIVGTDDEPSLLQVHKTEAGVKRDYAKRRHVYVTRHCVRGTGEAKPEYQAFASLPYPDWDSPDKWCTGGGFAIAQTVGAFLKERYGVVPEKVAVTNDLPMRKLQTGQALMAGIFAHEPGVWNLETDAPLFHPITFDCKAPDEATQMAEVKHLLETTPMPNGLGLPQDVDPAKWEAQLESFQRIIGSGSKDIMKLAPPNFVHDVSWDSKKGELNLGGSAEALKYFGQQLFYAQASGPGLEGKPITFGGQPLNVSIESLFPHYRWEHYTRQVSTAPSLKATNGVAMASAVLRQLAHGSEPGHMQIISDSDTQIDALRELFNLTWDVPPYGGSPGPTPPNVGLMFTMGRKGEVDIDVITVKFDGTLAPPIRVTPALQAKTSLAGLRKQLKAALKRYPSAAACAHEYHASF